jgi:hypothetical protein
MWIIRTKTNFISGQIICAVMTKTAYKIFVYFKYFATLLTTWYKISFGQLIAVQQLIKSLLESKLTVQHEIHKSPPLSRILMRFVTQFLSFYFYYSHRYTWLNLPCFLVYVVYVVHLIVLNLTFAKKCVKSKRSEAFMSLLCEASHCVFFSLLFTSLPSKYDLQQFFLEQSQSVFFVESGRRRFTYVRNIRRKRTIRHFWD